MFQALEHKISLCLSKNLSHRKERFLLRWILCFCVRKFKRVSDKEGYGIAEKDFGISGNALLCENGNFWGEVLKIKAESQVF